MKGLHRCLLWVIAVYVLLAAKCQLVQCRITISVCYVTRGPWLGKKDLYEVSLSYSIKSVWQNDKNVRCGVIRACINEDVIIIIICAASCHIF